MKINELGKVTETDVLVLGGGVAGCGAALAARDQGARVKVVDKGSLGACGQAGPGNANYHTHLGVAEWDSAAEYTKHYGGMAAAISPLIFHKAVSERLRDMLKRLEDIGIEFHKDPDGGYRRTASLGEPYPWTTTMMNSQNLKRLLAKEVRRVGVKATEHVMLTKILVEKGNGRVAGATGFHIWTGEFYIFRAKTVVLCLSTSNQRISTSSTNNPFNTWLYPFNTGSGPVIAYDAGAKIIALEKASASVLPIGFGAPGMSAFTGMGAYMINALGERYMFNYDPRGENAPHNIFVMATYNEIAGGRGPCYIDARHLPQDEMEHMVKDRLYVDGNTYPEYFTQRGLNLKKDLMEIEVGEIIGGGCPLVNNRLESNVKGLFGYTPSFLSHAVCGGYSSGVEASKDALKAGKLPEVDTDQVAKEKQKAFAPLKRDSGLTWREYEDVIRQVMNYYMGYVRSRQGMELALKKLKKIEDYVGEIRADNYHELLRANEAMHLIRYCQLTVRSALERKESGRGCYKRTDYPHVDPSWENKEVVQWQEHGEPKIIVQTVGE